VFKIPYSIDGKIPLANTWPDTWDCRTCGTVQAITDVRQSTACVRTNAFSFNFEMFINRQCIKSKVYRVCNSFKLDRFDRRRRTSPFIGRREEFVDETTNTTYQIAVLGDVSFSFVGFSFKQRSVLLYIYFLPGKRAT
jgi:hypothetical protein